MIADAKFTTCPTSRTLNVNAVRESTYYVADRISATAVNSIGADLPVTCDPDYMTEFNIGHTVVKCTAQDSYGNEAVCSFTIHIIGKAEIEGFEFRRHYWVHFLF